MTSNSGDLELATRFRELRRAEAASAPDFRRVLTREAVREPVPRRVAPAVLLALTGACVLAAILIARRRTEAPPAGRPPWISEWRASTDVLLAIPGNELLASTPALAEPVPDYSALVGAAPPRVPQPTRSPKGA